MAKKNDLLIGKKLRKESYLKYLHATVKVWSTGKEGFQGSCKTSEFSPYVLI